MLAIGALGITSSAFEEWKVQHGKVYKTAAEEATRYKVFLENSEAVRSQPNILSLNEFADMTTTEFVAERNGLIPGAMPTPTRQHKISGTVAPSSVDWRDHNLVNKVKNQGQCGSCWAFSTVVSIEGQHAKSTGNLVSLSEQNLVDCVSGVHDKRLPNNGTCCQGCQGGFMSDAFQYVIDKQGGGIDTESSYSYTGKTGTCAFNAKNDGASISAWTSIPAGDEGALLDAVATVGPISIGVDASSIGWQLYFGGIFKPLPLIGCSSSPKHMDHGVAIVGYGNMTVNGTSEDYWIIRNSWGAFWGQQGYMKIIRGKNACGLANAASYPTGVTL